MGKQLGECKAWAWYVACVSELLTKLLYMADQRWWIIEVIRKLEICGIQGSLETSLSGSWKLSNPSWSLYTIFFRNEVMNVRVWSFEIGDYWWSHSLRICFMEWGRLFKNGIWIGPDPYVMPHSYICVQEFFTAQYREGMQVMRQSKRRLLLKQRKEFELRWKW